MKIHLLHAAAVILILFTSCIEDYLIKGNGIIKSEYRLVPSFSSVASEGNFRVHITSGSSHKVVVQAESNLLPYIQTEVKGQKLRIHVRVVNTLQNQLPIEVYVTVPYLEELIQSGTGLITSGWNEGEAFRIVVSGSGSVKTSLDVGLLEAVVSGSGNLHLSGSARDASLLLSGSGRIDAWDMGVHNCDAKVSGSGEVWIDVENYLKAVISGSGNVFYRGLPVVETVVSGSGGVIHKN